MSITNSNFNQRSILGLHRDKVFTSPYTVSNSQLNIPFLQQNLGNVVTNNDASFNYNPYTKTLSVENIAATIVGSVSTIDVTDTTIDDTYYMIFTDSTGVGKILRANTSGISYNPSQNRLFVNNIFGSGFCQFNSVIATLFTGNGNNLTNLKTTELIGQVQNSQLQNSSLVLGNTTLTLGNTVTSLTGMNSITSNSFTGNGAGLTDLQTTELIGQVQNSQLQNPSLVLGTTNIPLGNTVTQLIGFTNIQSSTFTGVSTKTDSVKLLEKTTFSFGIKNYLMFSDLTLGDTPYEIPKYYNGLYYKEYDGEITAPNLNLTYGICKIGSNIKFDNTGNSYINTGNVGIGTPTPIYKLDIHSGASMDAIRFRNNLDTDGWIFRNIADNKFAIHQENVGDRMTFDGGNVGIGTTNPLDKLSLSGSNTYMRAEGANKIFGYYGGGNANSGTGSTNPWYASLSGFNGDAETIATSVYGWLWYNRSDNGYLELARRNNSTTDTQVMTFDRNNGNVGIGIPTPTAKLHVEGPSERGLIKGYNVYWDSDHATGSTTGSSFFNCRYNGVPIGEIYQASTSSINIKYTSDYRLKENVVEMPSMIDRIKKLRPVQFNYLEDPQDNLGFIAHEFKELFPNNCIVVGKKDGMKCECKNCKKPEGDCQCKEGDCCLGMIPDYMGMDYGKLTPICIKGIQELIEENENMKKEILELKDNQNGIYNRVIILENEELKSRLDRLEERMNLTRPLIKE